MAHLLLLANNRPQFTHLAEQLHHYKHLVSHVYDLPQAHRLLRAESVELILVEQALLRWEYSDFISYCHYCHFQIKLCALVKSEMANTISQQLEQGVDECLIETWPTTERLTRIDRLCRYQKVPSQDYLQYENLHLYQQTGLLKIGERSSILRRKEAEILSCLIKYKNRVVTREMLIEQVWSGEQEIPTFSTIDVYLRRIRAAVAGYRDHIKTVRGYGYMLCDF